MAVPAFIYAKNALFKQPIDNIFISTYDPYNSTLLFIMLNSYLARTDKIIQNVFKNSYQYLRFVI